MRGRLAVAVAVAVLALPLAGCAARSSDGQTFDSGGLPTAAPAESGFDPKLLDGLAAEAGSYGSTCFLVARQGKVVLARYWGAAGPRPRKRSSRSPSP